MLSGDAQDEVLERVDQSVQAVEGMLATPSTPSAEHAVG
jgi:hypothetical protein